MNHNPDLHAQKVLSGTAKVGGDSTRSSGGDDEKECAFSLVEVLDEVRGIFLAPHQTLTQNR